MNYIGDLIDQVGETATLRYETSKTINKYGDGETTTDTTKIDGVFQFIDAGADELDEGEYEEGDLRVFLKSTVNNIELGNVIVYNGTEYQIDNIQEHNLNASSSHYELRAKQI